MQSNEITSIRDRKSWMSQPRTQDFFMIFFLTDQFNPIWASVGGGGGGDALPTYFFK